MLASTVQDPEALTLLLNQPYGWILVLLFLGVAALPSIVSLIGSKSDRTYANVIEREHREIKELLGQIIAILS